jgi:hypothetical protein
MRYDRGMLDLGWLQALIAHPPRCLSELEARVGALDVDFAGGEGMGMVMRYESMRERGRVRAGVDLVARFAWDMHHQEPTRPRDMQLDSLELGLDAGYVTVDELLAQQYGPGRAIDARREYGAWFYVSARGGGSTTLAWSRERPAWALPAVTPAAQRAFLAALTEQLAAHRTVDPIVAALSPLAPSVGAEIWECAREHRGIRFRPSIPLPEVADALQIIDPVSHTTSNYMDSWEVVPLADTTQPRPPQLRFASWRLAVKLERGPQGEKLRPFGMASLYAVGAADRVERILFERG